MAKKEPETVDRFRVTAEVPKEQLGHIIAELTKMGLQHVSYDLVTDVLNYKNKPKFETSGLDYMRAWVKDHATFTRKEAVAHYVAGGRSPDSISTVLSDLVKAKEIKMLGDGNYQRADVKAITGPAKKANGAAKPEKAVRQRQTRPAQNYDTPNLDFILKRIRQVKKFTLPEMEAYFVKHGRNKKSVGALLTGLTATHKVRRVGIGQYVTVSGRDYAHERELRKKREAEKQKLNGAATVEATAPEAQANG